MNLNSWMKKCSFAWSAENLAPHLCSAPSSSGQVLPTTRTGMYQTSLLGCALVVSQTTKNLETCQGNPLSSTAEISQGHHRKGREYPDHDGFEAVPVLFQFSFIPAWLLLSAVSAPLAHLTELGGEITPSLQHPGLLLLQGGFCSCFQTSYNTIFQCCKECSFCWFRDRALSLQEVGMGADTLIDIHILQNLPERHHFNSNYR